MTFQEFGPYLFDKKDGKIAMLTGIRTQESLKEIPSYCKEKKMIRT
jgi:predicted phosphoadenosine phosphosulfate sulfurtransferase